jgi:hypothetical protein
VQGEFLDERRFHENPEKTYYERRIDVKPIGYIDHESFKEGIKYLPMIKDQAFIVKESMIAAIFSKQEAEGIRLGQLLKEEIPIFVPWKRLFNTHIGIFGNTGSGKSNTLTKLYTALFEQKANNFAGRSKFSILDFNGEYTGNQLLPAANKKVYNLKTGQVQGDRFPIASTEFWNPEVLSILFQATQNTQRPFLNRLVSGRERFKANAQSLNNYFRKIFEDVFSAASKRIECLDLLRRIAVLVSADGLVQALTYVRWQSGNASTFVHDLNGTRTFFNANLEGYNQILRQHVEAVNCNTLDDFEEFVLRSHLLLTRDLNLNFVQFDHIQPLLKRAEAALNHLKRVLIVCDEEPDDAILTVVSLRNCNQEVKKILPLLVAKHYYARHRNAVASPPDRTMHLIIDEAHNILSEQSSREHEAWRDYRLELFEEIIKEGRKFGMFITLSSQRPADISPTVVSQLHNFFIHRLVNDRDLFLIDNTISTLDSMSKSLIPSLSKGCCIVTGTSFDLPMTVQVDMLERSKQPDSEDVDLGKLWSPQGVGVQ